MTDDPPVLDAYRVGPSGRQQLHVWCVYEHCWHHHGAGDKTGDGDGHRVAHCTAASSPYKDGGYILREVPGPCPSNSEAASLGALQRGYLTVHGPAPTVRTAYWQQVREWGVCAVILDLRGHTASLTWNGDEVEDRARSELCANGIERRFPNPQQVAEQSIDSMHDLLWPYMERARQRRAEGHFGLWYGGLYGFNREDGEAVAEQVASFIKSICPPPESRAAFYARLDAGTQA